MSLDKNNCVVGLFVAQVIIKRPPLVSKEFVLAIHVAYFICFLLSAFKIAFFEETPSFSLAHEWVASHVFPWPVDCIVILLEVNVI